MSDAEAERKDLEKKEGDEEPKIDDVSEDNFAEMDKSDNKKKKIIKKSTPKTRS